MLSEASVRAPEESQGNPGKHTRYPGVSAWETLGST